MHTRKRAFCVCALLAVFMTALAARAEAQAPATATAAAEEGLIQLNLPPVVDLKLLIDYVSKRMSMNIIYDESLAGTKVTILSPTKIRKEELVDLLRNALKMSGLELVDTSMPNWKTIGRKALVRFVQVRNVSAADLAKRVSTVLDERDRIGGAGARRAAIPRAIAGAAAVPMAAAAGAEVTLVPDAKTNQIAVIATEAEMAGALALLDSLDVSPDVETKTYRLRHISPQRIDTLMKNRTAAESSEANYASTLDEASGLLMVTAKGGVHKQVELLVHELDVEADPNRSNIQFYKLVNATAADVLRTIRGLQRGGSAAVASRQQENSSEQAVTPTAAMNMLGGALAGPNVPSSPGLEPVPLPPAYHAGPASQAAEAEAPASVASVLGKDAIVTADQNTNAIIVVAPPEVQRLYKQLIASLDKRRPQVLVEVTLVTLDTSESFSLGVELGKTKITDDNTVIVFNSFGLSTIDPATGIPTIKPTTGFNGVLISPESLNVVVQALATNGRSKVLAAPKILMNDNATGNLASISESPFTSVNASQTVSTTSFAGYASAGTTVMVTPHISEGDYLQLKYSVALNSFTDKSTNGIPPPRQTDTIGSEVTVPDGYAVVVGGLTRKDFNNTVSKVPLLGDIPILGYLFSLNDQKQRQSTLFVFIRPIILRDDKFEDLKYLSEKDLALAEQVGNYPSSDPMVVR